MRRINYIITLLLLAIGVNWAKADDQTLALGNYDEVVNGDWNEDQTYQGSWWMIAPTQFNVKHTGSQIIYTKSQLADLAGKEIKGLSFVYYNQGAFSAFPRTVNVWVKEIDDSEFAYDSAKKAYKYFEYSDATKATADYSFDFDFVEYYCMNGEISFNFDKPFAYSGEKNLLVTITFDGDDTSDSPTDIEFYYNTDAKNMAMTTCSDKSSFADFNESEDWPFATGGGSAISHATKLEQPLTKFSYQEASKPVEKPSVLSGKVVSNEDNAPVKDATITVKNDNNEYSATTDENGTYSIEVTKSEETYTLTAKADGYEEKAIADLTFTPGEPKTQDITLIKIDNPSTMTGKVTCNGEPVEGAAVKLAAKDNKYITYSTKTSADGTYLLNVVKSEKTYTLTVTDGECEDYTEDNIAFTPGESTIKNISLTKAPEPENSVTLGKYDKMLKDGTGIDGEVYYGHGYSWAAAPTNFSHQYTGSEIIYTKEQLQKMAGKAISQINFVFHNESAYDAYPRTVNVWVKEIDNNAFDYDDKAWAYKFFDYEDASVAIANYGYDGELLDYAGGNGEMELVFDKPLNYSGEKNLLVALTFEGENTCNVLDFNFYYNPEQTKKAMTYFSDKYTFGDFAETEDWPYVNDDCVPSLEQPITRFFYTDAMGINNIATGNKANIKANGETTYNLAGQRVGKSYKGIVISNGKKFVK